MTHSQNNLTKQSFLEAYQVIQKLLVDKVLWKIGASGALLIHGIKRIPNDIDLIIHSDDYEKAVNLMSDYVVGETEDLGFALKTTFVVNHIEGELLAFDDFDKVEMRKIEDYNFPVTPLEIELKYYKMRNDKPEANKHKIKLIEAELIRRSDD